MPMSGSCPRNKRRAPPASGFTLLELLIVLALIAMMAAMVAPRLQRTYDAVARSGERAEARRQLERLPLRARAAGQAIEIPAGDAEAFARQVPLPEGWTMSAPAPLRIEANGICLGGDVAVQAPGLAETWRLSAPDCGVADAR